MHPGFDKREDLPRQSDPTLAYMPCTNRCDKNGREIYEGDIPGTEQGSLAVVVWETDRDNYRLRWLRCQHPIEMRIRHSRTFDEQLGVLKVVGSRFQNAGMLDRRSVIYIDGWTPDQLET